MRGVDCRGCGRDNAGSVYIREDVYYYGRFVLKAGDWCRIINFGRMFIFMGGLFLREGIGAEDLRYCHTCHLSSGKFVPEIFF